MDELNKTLGRRVQERTGELERAINEEKKAKDIAEKANKAKDQFLAKVSHDIRTPMNSINGFIKLLLQSELKPEQTEYLNIVNSSAHYLIGIINDILNFSKMESGQFEIRRSNFQLKKILNDIKNNFTQPANEKNIQFEIALLSNVPTSLYGDDIRLEQILNNLVGNAIRYTQEGKVRVEVSCIDKKSDNATILFKVSDTGKGIPREDRQRIFLPYEQLDKNKTVDSRNGVGLGLTISQQLVNKMGGKIEVESEPGKGSKFFFSIPFEIHSNIVNDSTTKSIETKLIDLSILKKRHVLVVEDDRASQFLLKIILENAEISVDCANDGREAMEKIFRTPYDIILMDMGLPEISGPEVIIKVRQEKRFEKLPIIAVTADAIVGNQQIYLDAGADDCLLKPIDTEILLSALVKWIEKGERV
ncbi:MAG: ATP-binding protein [Candidatus Omnitrophota bacterium]